MKLVCTKCGYSKDGAPMEIGEECPWENCDGTLEMPRQSVPVLVAAPGVANTLVRTSLTQARTLTDRVELRTGMPLILPPEKIDQTDSETGTIGPFLSSGN